MSRSLVAGELQHQVGLALASEAGTFHIPAGRHTILGTELPTRQCFISNNDHGNKPILFDLEGARDFVLDGEGATLNCCGSVLPIRVGNGRNIIIRNVTIDWVRPSFTQAEVLDARDGRLDFVYDPVASPLSIEHGQLIARDPFDGRTGRLWNLLPFDKDRKEVSRRQENWHLSRGHQAQALGPDRLRLEAAFPENYAPGTPLVLMHGDRVAPGIWIEDAQDVLLENVTIHHAPGMGVIAQRSRNITLDRVRVLPSGTRLFSTWVDAVHMTDCDGTTRLLNCDLRGQFDDAVNLHARFVRVGHRTGPCSAYTHTVHPQQAGPSPATPGAGWAFYRRRTLEQGLVTTVRSVRYVDPTTAEITWEDPLPAGDEEWVGARYHPESVVDIQGCRFGANRGRGVLINLEHQVTIHHNHFHVSGRGVESIPDANYWWEGSPVRDLSIHHNTFEDCGFGPCGMDQIYLGPELPNGADPQNNPVRATEQAAIPCAQPVLKNIRIEDNLFIRHSGSLLHVHGVDGLVFRGNRVLDSTRYPVTPATALIELGAGMGRYDVEPATPPAKSPP